MVENLIAKLGLFVISVISAMGYLGVMLLMAIESACFPLPSEVIMPFSGYLVYTGRFNIWQRVGATSPKEIARLPSIRD